MPDIAISFIIVCSVQTSRFVTQHKHTLAVKLGRASEFSIRGVVIPKSCPVTFSRSEKQYRFSEACPLGLRSRFYASSHLKQMFIYKAFIKLVCTEVKGLACLTRRDVRGYKFTKIS